jgi:3-dehydrosphinganine reductase
MNFKQQHIIITGGSSGIGKATAKLFAKQGANIYLISRDFHKLNLAQIEIQNECVLPEQKIMIFSADVGDRPQIETTIKSIIDNHGEPDILINSAGIAHPDYFQKLSLDVFEKTMAINYFGSLYCIKAVLPAMEKRKKGHIVMLSSGAGLIGIFGYSAYSSSKFAIRGLAESLRGELKLLGINISIVYPPDTDTPQLQQENKTKPKETKMITESVKIWSPEAVAQEIIKGINNKNFIITPGIEMTILAKFHSLISSLINHKLDHQIAKIKQSN